MINIPPIKPSTEIKTELLPDISKTWHIGKTLSATVERGGEALEKILLRIGRYQLEARTPVAAKTGDQLKLLVKSLGDTPLLSIQVPVQKNRLAAEQLRSVIARQQDVSGLVKLAQQLIPDKQQLLPTPLKTQLRELLQLLPRSEQLVRAETLKTVIRNSGVFLESRLLQQPPQAVRPDVKAALLKISQLIQRSDLTPPQTVEGKTVELSNTVKQYIRGDISLQQLASSMTVSLNKTELTAVLNYLSTKETMLPPALAIKLPQLFQHIQQQPNAKQLMDSLFSLLRNLPPLQELKAAVDGSLARITSQQLMPLTRDGDSTPLLLQFDLPVKDKDSLQLFKFSIEEETGGGDHQHSSWSITINFDFDPLGPVQARLHLIDQQIAAVLQAEKASTVNIIQQNLGLLEQGFARAGLQAVKLDVTSGRPTEPRQTVEGVHLLDEQA